MKKDIHREFLVSCLEKMFDIVGAKYTIEFTKQKDWYVKRVWDEQQENEFKDFFIKEAKKQLNFSKKVAEKEFGWFNLNFGWKRKKI